jgi:general secretion pathway protein G
MTRHNKHGVLLLSCAVALGFACIGCQKSSDKWGAVLDEYEKYSEQRVTLDERKVAGDKNASSELASLMLKVRPLADQLKTAHDRGWLTDAQEQRLQSLNRRMFGEKQEAKITTARLGINNIKSALQNFEMNCGRFPTTEEGLQALIQAPGNLPGWKGPYLHQQIVPLDSWQQPYQYRCPGLHNNNFFDLHSYGPDMQDGGGDDIDNWSGRALK